MNNLKDSFEDVADWCEEHLEGQRGREIGMTFGAMLRAYGRLANLPSRLHGEQPLRHHCSSAGAINLRQAIAKSLLSSSTPVKSSGPSIFI
jgi:hypothetical protein